MSVVCARVLPLVVLIHKPKRAPPGTSIQRGSNRVMSRRNQKSGYVLLLHIERARHIELITSPPISCTGWVGSTPSNTFASSVSTCLYSLNGADPHCSPPFRLRRSVRRPLDHPSAAPGAWHRESARTVEVHPGDATCEEAASS